MIWLNVSLHQTHGAAAWVDGTAQIIIRVRHQRPPTAERGPRAASQLKAAPVPAKTHPPANHDEGPESRKGTTKHHKTWAGGTNGGGKKIQTTSQQYNRDVPS
jgi:hypothetical protein